MGNVANPPQLFAGKSVRSEMRVVRLAALAATFKTLRDSSLLKPQNLVDNRKRRVGRYDMRSLRTLFVPLLTGTFIATTAAIPAVAQDNGPYDNSQAQMQQQDNSPAYGPSYDNDQSAVQPQDQENDQYNGPEMQPQQDQLNSEDPGRAAVEQVDSTPPPFPADAYDQPPMPGDGYVWTPGYWGWNGGWNWIPGAWAYPPYVGALWTPGYWGWAGGYYGWYPGYWGLTVGFYGGIYYGCGYWGRGFYGGRWDHGHYYNNRNANNIRNTSFHSYSGERSPSGSGGRQFSSAGYARGAVDRGAANGRDAMNESAARANAYDSIRGGGMQLVPTASSTGL